MTKFLCSMALFAGLLATVGCGLKSDEPKPEPVKGGAGTEATPKPKDDDETGHGWWCDEHGVKEAECSMCSSKVAKAFQAKGDWCKEHNRAKSQCFICDPKLREKYAAEYRTKFGKEPPEPTENMPPKKG